MRVQLVNTLRKHKISTQVMIGLKRIVKVKIKIIQSKCGIN